MKLFFKMPDGKLVGPAQILRHWQKTGGRTATNHIVLTEDDKQPIHLRVDKKGNMEWKQGLFWRKIKGAKNWLNN